MSGGTAQRQPQTGQAGRVADGACSKQAGVQALSQKADLISNFHVFSLFLVFSLSSTLFTSFSCVLSHWLLELTQFLWEMRFYRHNRSSQSLIYKQGYYCSQRIYYYCCETTAMPSYLTLQLHSCFLPAAESVTNCPFKKLQACKLGMCYFILLLLLQNVVAL